MNTPSIYKDPEVVVQELLSLQLKERMKFERCISALSYCGLDPDELKAEIVVRTLGGTRKCPANVATSVFAIQTARSIADDAYRKTSKMKDTFVQIESEDDIPVANTRDPEQILMQSQERENLKQFIKSLFTDDEQALDYINRRLDGDDKSEIMQDTKLDDKQFETIRRRVMRRLQNPKIKEK